MTFEKRLAGHLTSIYVESSVSCKGGYKRKLTVYPMAPISINASPYAYLKTHHHPSRMKGTLKSTVKTQRIKLRTSSSERRALTATPAPIMNSSKLILPATVPIAKKFNATRLLQRSKGRRGCGSEGKTLPRVH